MLSDERNSNHLLFPHEFDETESIDDQLNLNEESSEYSFRYNDLKKLHSDTNCTVKDVMLIINAFSVRHDLTYVAIEDLIKLVNEVIGKNLLSPSKYNFKKSSKIDINPECQTVTHIICHLCDQYLEKTSEIEQEKITHCSNCQTEIQINTKYKKNHFITLPIRYHLQNVLEQNNQHLNFHVNNFSSTICDVHDSFYFRKMRSEFENTPFITLTVSTDGESA